MTPLYLANYNQTQLSGIKENSYFSYPVDFFHHRDKSILYAEGDEMRRCKIKTGKTNTIVRYFLILLSLSITCNDNLYVRRRDDSVK